MTPHNALAKSAVSQLGDYPADQVALVAAKAYVRLAQSWKLNTANAAALIAVSPRTWARMKSGNWSGSLSQDQLLRISAATGLYKGLQLYFAPDLADKWINMRNSGPLFAGRTPLETMIAGGLPSMIEVRAYVDALRGGA